MVTGMYGEQLVLGSQSPVNGVNLINSQMKRAVAVPFCIPSSPLSTLTILHADWTAYGVESNRFGFNGNISVHDMAETYLEPLHIMLRANVSAAMCAYVGLPKPLCVQYCVVTVVA